MTRWQTPTPKRRENPASLSVAALQHAVRMRGMLVTGLRGEQPQQVQQVQQPEQPEQSAAEV